MVKKKIGIIMILLSLISLSLAYLFLTSVDDYKMSDDAYFHVNGVEYSIDKNEVVEVIDDTTLKISDFELGANTYSFPIYYRNGNKILLTSKMLYHEPSYQTTIKKYKLKQLTEITYNASSLNVSFSRDNNSSNEYNGFLYDGKNTYIFLEKMSLTYNDKEIAIAPLSCAIVEYNSLIQIYDVGNAEYYFEELNTAAIATAQNGLYSINLSTDVVSYGTSDIVLISSIDVYEDYFTGERE